MECIYAEDNLGAQKPLTERLLTELRNTENVNVLWLVSGGSNIALSVAVMDQLPDDLTSKLTVVLTDERFGPVGHPDSNLQQLVAAGFDPKQATVIGVLMPGVALAETCERYNTIIAGAFAAASVSIAQFGIGSDGHIAGILPGSPALDSQELVTGYETPQYTRITLTMLGLRKISVAYAFAFGDSKLTALTNLRDKDIALGNQPSQVLKQISESYVYSDQFISTPNKEGNTI
jgi:6-phosphogluconolactonase/glucosamine-6-phosphate isomerase/deaminase